MDSFILFLLYTFLAIENCSNIKNKSDIQANTLHWDKILSSDLILKKIINFNNLFFISLPKNDFYAILWTYNFIMLLYNLSMVKKIIKLL